MSIDELFKTALTRLADQSFTVIFLICVLVFLLRERRADISHYRQREAMFTAFTIALVVGFIKVVAPQVVIDNEIVRQAENIEDTPSP